MGITPDEYAWIITGVLLGITLCIYYALIEMEITKKKKEKR